MYKILLTLFSLSAFLTFSPTVHALDGTWRLIQFRKWAMFHFCSISFSDPRNGWIGGTKLYRTRDGGLTWEVKMGDPSDPEVRDVVFIDDNKGWIAAGRNGLLVTEDGGSSWQRIPGEMPEGSVNSVFFINETSGWVIMSTGSFDNLVLATRDAGRTFTDVTPPELAEGNIFLDSLFHHPDFAKNWLVMTVDPSFQGVRNVYRPRLFFINENEGWLNTAAGLLFTENGGEGWRVVREGCILDFTALDRNTVIALAEDADNGRVLSVSIDGGGSFTDIPAPGKRFYNIYFLDANLGWAATVRGIYHTVDGGNTWQLQYTIDPEPHRQLVGFTIEWQDPRNPFFYEMFFNADSTGYAVGAGNAFYMFTPAPLGDLNNNGVLDIFDLLEFLRILSQEPSQRISTADLNSDGVVDVSDLTELLRLLGK